MLATRIGRCIQAGEREKGDTNVRCSVAVLFFAATVLAGCHGENAQREVTRAQAIEIADAYVERNYPMMPRNILRPVVRDQGATWLVTYDVVYEDPEDVAGGTPTIEVEKRTGQVVGAHAGQ